MKCLSALRKCPPNWEKKVHDTIFMETFIHLRLAVCKGLLTGRPWTLFIFFFPRDLHNCLPSSLPLHKLYSVTALWRVCDDFLLNSTIFIFFSEPLPLKALNKFTIWLLFLFWDVWTYILKQNMCIFSRDRFQSRFFYGIDLIKREIQLISLKFIFMYLYSMRHYRHINLILDLIPFEKMIWISL